MRCLLFAAILGHAAAFGVVPTNQRTMSQNTALFYYPDKQFDRAVKCADKYGLCEIEELDKLADELEEYQSCFFEKDKQLCDKEIQDRQDVAEVLRMQGELRLRMDYLKNANLFADDVKEQHHENDRDNYVDYLQAFQSW